MKGVGITYLWLGKEFPPFIRLEGRRGDYEVYTLERTCHGIMVDCNDGLLPPFRVYCSECDDEWGFTPNYCPNCGARVEKGDKHGGNQENT